MYIRKYSTFSVDKSKVSANRSVVPSVGKMVPKWYKRSRCMDKRTCCCKEYIGILAAVTQHMINVSDTKHRPIIFRSLN